VVDGPVDGVAVENEADGHDMGIAACVNRGEPPHAGLGQAVALQLEVHAIQSAPSVAACNLPA
jgi:hypothetical protein